MSTHPTCELLQTSRGTACDWSGNAAPSSPGRTRIAAQPLRHCTDGRREARAVRQAAGTRRWRCSMPCSEPQSAAWDAAGRARRRSAARRNYLRAPQGTIGLQERTATHTQQGQVHVACHNRCVACVGACGRTRAAAPHRQTSWMLGLVMAAPKVKPRERERERETDTDRETERQRDRERHRDTET
eukprot:7389153-Prymnesium_polylepis.1